MINCWVSRDGKVNTMAMLAALLLGAFFSQVAWSSDDDDRGWLVPKGTAAKNMYVGVGIGRNNSDSPDSNQDGSVTGISRDKTDISKGVTVGYQLNDKVAIQGGYKDLGETDFRGVSSGGPSWSAGPVRTIQEADGWELGVVGRWPISERWYALGFLGWFWWESEETYIESGFVSKWKDSGSDATYALGFEFDCGLKDRIVYRFMGTHHQIGSDDADVNGLSAELVYRFP